MSQAHLIGPLTPVDVIVLPDGPTVPVSPPQSSEPAPLISLGLPVYNGERYVADAIGCAQGQTIRDWELVICDNGSTDRTLEICREFAAADPRIRLYRNPRNLGFCANFNRVFQLSRGRYFKWITHDDLFGAEFLAACLQALDRDPEALVVFPRMGYVDGDGRRLRGQGSDLSIVAATPESRVRRLTRLEREGTDVYWFCYGLSRRDTWQKTPLMDFYNASDQTLMLELALLGNLKQLDQELFFRREHAEASTVRRNWTAKDRAKFANVEDRRWIVFPYCRMLKEHLRSIFRSPLSFGGKLRCAASVARRFASQWKYFAHEMIDSPMEVLRPSQ